MQGAGFKENVMSFRGIQTSFAEEVLPSLQDWPQWTSHAEFSFWEDFEIEQRKINGETKKALR